MKNMKTWLLISLCANLLLAGLFVGGALSNGKRDGMNGPRDEIGALLYHAPDRVREGMRDDMRRSVEARRENEPKGRMAEFVEILSAPELNLEELKAHFAKSRASNTANAKDAHERMIKALSDMTLEERMEVAEKMRAQMERGKPKDH